MRALRPASIVLAAGLILTVMSSGSAAPGSYRDPDDVATPLDIRDVEWADGGGDITYTDRTYGPFADEDVNLILWSLETSGDTTADYHVVVQWIGFDFYAAVLDAAYSEVAPATASRPDGSSLRVVYPMSAIGSPSSYFFQAGAWHDSNTDGQVQPGELDTAPDADVVRHVIGTATPSPTPSPSPTPTPSPTPSPSPTPAPTASPTPTPEPTPSPTASPPPTPTPTAPPTPPPTEPPCNIEVNEPINGHRILCVRLPSASPVDTELVEALLRARV